MRKSKLILSMLLTGVVSMSLLAGCGSKAKEASTTSSGDGKIKEFTMFSATPGKEVPDTNRLKKVIAEKIGAKITESWLTGQTAKERIGVMVAGGDYPDFIDGGEGTQALLDAGALVPLEDKIDKYPNIAKFLSASDRKRITKDDGHIYYIPQFSTVLGKETDTTHNGEAFWIQKAILEWANYPQIKTIDEYFALIEKYKEANPTIDGQPTIGFEILSDDWRYFCLENPPQFLAGYPNDGKAIIDPKTGVAKNYNTIPEAEQYYKKLNQEFNKGIIDPETFTASYDQYISKISTGRVLGMIDQQWQFNNANLALKQQGKDERTYVPLPLVIDPNVKPQYRSKLEFNGGGGIGISTSCKDVDGALKVINDLLDPEVIKLRTWGEKDKDYKVDDKGVFSRTEEQRTNAKNQDWVNANFCPYAWFPNYRGMLADGINCASPGDQPDEFYSTLSKTDKNILDHYGYKKFTDFMNTPPEENTPWFPIYSYTNSLTADHPAGIAIAKMDDIKKQWLPKVIMTGTDKFDSAWKEYQTTLTTQVDMKTYEDTLTKEAQRRKEAFGKK
jgi:putative aldouronate transport system substrate-binding protein